jgi:hypothetical protein
MVLKVLSLPSQPALGSSALIKNWLWSHLPQCPLGPAPYPPPAPGVLFPWDQPNPCPLPWRLLETPLDPVNRHEATWDPQESLWEEWGLQGPSRGL